MGKKKNSSKKKKGSALGQLVKSTIGQAAEGKGGDASSSSKTESSSKHHSSSSGVVDQSHQGASAPTVSVLVPKVAVMDSPVGEEVTTEVKVSPPQENLSPEVKDSLTRELNTEMDNAAVEGLTTEVQKSAAGEGVTAEVKDNAAGEELTTEVQKSAAGEGVTGEVKDNAAGEELTPEIKKSVAREGITAEVKDIAVGEELAPKVKGSPDIDETILADATLSPSKGDAQSSSSLNNSAESGHDLPESPTTSPPSASFRTSNSSDDITIPTAANSSASPSRNDSAKAAAVHSLEGSPHTAYTDSFTSAVESVGDEFEEAKEGDSDSDSNKSLPGSRSETAHTPTPSDQSLEFSKEIAEGEANTSATAASSDIMDETVKETTQVEPGQMSAEESQVVEALDKAVEGRQESKSPSDELHKSSQEVAEEDSGADATISAELGDAPSTQEQLVVDDTKPLVPQQQQLPNADEVPGHDIESASNDLPSAHAAEKAPTDDVAEKIAAAAEVPPPSQTVADVELPSGGGDSGVSEGAEKEPSNPERKLSGTEGKPPGPEAQAKPSSDITKVVSTESAEIVPEPNNLDSDSKTTKAAGDNGTGSAEHQLTESQRIKPKVGASPVDESHGCCTVL